MFRIGEPGIRSSYEKDEGGIADGDNDVASYMEQ
jgi:hypothetical protein